MQIKFKGDERVSFEEPNKKLRMLNESRYSNIIKNLESQIITLQKQKLELEKGAKSKDIHIHNIKQQNKQMRQALVILRDALAKKKHYDRTSHGLWQVADKSIQGGEQT